MADSKISQLTSATTPLAGTEVLPIVQSGATKQVSIDNLTAGRNFSAGTITANIIVPTVAEFPDGTAAAPSITNTGDLDTGMYFPAANAVSLVTAGVNRLRINSAGDVGIGTITPGARLDVRGSATFNEDGANVDFRVEGDTDANLFFVDASADFVGIGTATPTQKLTVAGSTTTVQGNTITSNNLAGNAFSLVSNSDATAGSSSSVLLWNNNGFSASSAALSFFSSSSSVPDELRLSNGAAAPITFYTNGSERVRINSSGNVGVGTANPLTILSAYNTTNAFVSSQSTTGYAGLQATNTSGTIYFGIDNSTAGGFSAGNYSRVIWSSGAYPLVLATNGNERMRITDTGNVGIGTSTPTSKLDVNGTITATGFSVSTLTVTGNTYLATTSGDVGIGTTSPANKLHVTGTGSTPTLFERTGSNGVYLQLKDASGASVFLGADNGLFAVQTPGSSYSNKLVVDSSGNVGIGTSSPLQQLHLSSASATGMQITYQGVGASRIGVAAGNLLTFGLDTSNGTTTRMTLDSSGNLGLGVTPSASTLRTLQGPNAEFIVAARYPYVASNATYNSQWFYTNSEAASFYVQATGQHQWFTAPSGTAGNAISFTQAMTLDASGNLGVGTSSPNTRLEVSGAEAIVSLRVNTANSGISASNYSEIQLSDLGAVRAFWRNLRDGSGKTAFAYNNHLAFLSDGGGAPTERMRITSTGDVGIGTGSPAAKLQVTATGGVYNAAVSIATDIGGGVLVQSTSSGTNSRVGLFLQGSDQIGAAIASAREDAGATWKTYLSFYTNNLTGGNVLYLQEKMRITSAGDVGIGTSSPVGKLGVAGSQTVGFNAGLTGSPEAGNLFYTTDGTGWQFRIGKYQSGAFTSQMVFTDAGNIGIGTTSPTAKLDIVGSGATIARLKGGSGTNQGAAFYIEQAGSTNTLFAIGDSAAILGGTPDAAVNIYTANSVPLTMAVGSTEKVRITAAGDVGIGTASPAQKLTVSGGNLFVSNNTAGSATALVSNSDATAGSNAGLLLWNNNGFSATAGSLYFYSSTSSVPNELRMANGGAAPITFYTNGSERMRLDSAGNLGIGTASASSKLTVDGVTSVGSGNKLSLIGLDINSGGTPTYVKILTTIPTASANADFTVNIKGFIYGAATTTDLSICWHYYNSTFYNATAKSSGGWAPTIRLSSESGYVAIVLSSPGYWPKFYVESMYSSYYNDDYASGWSWVDADATGSPIVTVSYSSNFGNSFVMTTNGNVGIGTSSPANLLHVNGSNSIARFSGASTSLSAYQTFFNNSAAQAYFGIESSTGTGIIGTGAAYGMVLSTASTNPLAFGTNNTERMRIDSSGNLGLGVTPSAWKSDQRALQIGASGSLVSNTSANNLLSSSNAYFDAGAAYRYIANGFATQYEQYLGKHAWYTAPSGTAGNAIGFTQAMTLDASGSLGVGVTDPDAPVTIQANSGANAIRIRGRATGNLSYLVFRNNANSADLGVIGSGDVGITFDYGGTERARIDSSGNLLVGTTSTSALTAFTGSAVGQVIQSGVPVLALVDSDDTTNGVVWLANSSGVGYLYTKAANPFVFGTNGVEKMRLDASGNLSIGQASSALQSGGTGITLYGSSSSEIKFLNSTTGSSATDGTALVTSGSDFVINNRESGAVTFGTSNTERMRLDSSGNLGLGVTPSAWGNGVSMQGSGWSLSTLLGFDQSAMYTNARQTAYGNFNTNWVYRGTASATGYAQASGSHVWLTAPSGTAGNAISFTQAMTLDASGNLLVGTTANTESAKLNVQGGYIFLKETNGGDVYLRSAFGSGTDPAIQVASNDPLLFATNNNERMRITSAGDVGIGTASPSQKLEVAGTIATSGGNAVIVNNNAGSAYTLIGNSNSAAGSNAGMLLWNDNGFSSVAGSLYFYSSGSTVANELRLANGGNAPITMYTNGSERVRIKGDGEVQIAGTTDRGAYNLQCNGTGVWGAGAYVNGSDERLKDNIQTLTDGLSIVTQLRPVTYQYKPEYSKDQSIQPGFIAQELQQAMEGKAYVEGVVQAGPEYLNVAYQNLIPILTKAIQELNAKVAALEAQLNRP